MCSCHEHFILLRRRTGEKVKHVVCCRRIISSLKKIGIKGRAYLRNTSLKLQQANFTKPNLAVLALVTLWKIPISTQCITLVTFYTISKHVFITEDNWICRPIPQKSDKGAKRQGTLCLQTCFPRAKRLMCWWCSQISALVFLCQAKEELKMENQRLKDENGALIRVITKLSKWGWTRRRRTQSMSLNLHSSCVFIWSVLGKNVWVVFEKNKKKLDCFF